MTDIGFTDSAEGVVPPRNSAPGDRSQTSETHWGVLAKVLYFIAQRLFYGIIVLLAVIFLTYLGLSLARGTGLGESLQQSFAQTVEYVSNLLRGDLGYATAASGDVRPRPMGEVIIERMSRSLGLLFLSLALAMIVGVTLGMRAARSGSKRSLGIILATIIGVSVPSFFAAFLLQWALTSYTRWSGNALLPMGGFGWDEHLILPVIVLAARPLAQITRISFVSLRDILKQDYVRTAQAKGLRKYQIRWAHVMRNAAIPILTTVGISFRFALSTLAVVEFYFGWQGAGFTLLKSISQQDDNLTVTFVLLLGVLIILFNFILDISYRLIDPRLWEPPAHVIESSQQGIVDMLRSFGRSLQDAAVDNRVVRSLSARLGGKVNDFQDEDQTWVEEVGKDLDEPFIGKRSIWIAMRRNGPFSFGGLLVLVLAVLVIFGPLMSPHNPYSTQGLVNVDGVLTRPPLPPSETYPWGTDALGRDMMSLILAGAQQTLFLVVVVVVARFVLGVLLGAIAGWRNGSLVDRIILGLAEVVAAFPNLLLAMILILALGIRQGMSTFLIALGFIGWGEIMQFVRSKVGALRSEQFVESAVASGASTGRIINTHIMPNLFGALISLVALEMGSVLMLLGELGFLSIFVGGGLMIELPGVPPQLFSDVPEWGALLSNIRYQARAYPWTGFYTMTAFFLAIFAFNLFGEGVRRAVESGHLIISRFINRYSVAFAIFGILFFNWFQANSGATPFYRNLAQAFAGTNTMTHVKALTTPEMQGRSLGTPGQAAAAQYIADQMALYGLQAGGESATYFQERLHSFERLEGEPQLVIDDGGPPLVFGKDYAAYPGLNMTDGEAAGQIKLVGIGKPSTASVAGWRISYPELDRVDYSDDILLAVSDYSGRVLSWRTEHAGLLVVVDDPAKLAEAHTLSGRSGKQLDLFTGELKGEETPAIWISEETGNRLLEDSGYTVAELRENFNDLLPESVWEKPLPVFVGMQVEGKLEEKWPVQHVIGYRPGDFGYELCVDCLDKELVVVMAQYDNPPPGPNGQFAPGANDNASGVAVMLEAIRVLEEADYQPRRSFLFIAYSGEGLDGGEPVSDPEIKKFLQAKTGFASRFEPVAIVQLRGLGDGSGNRLEVSSAGSLRLADLFETSAKQSGVDSVRSEEPIDMSLIYEEVSSGSDTGGKQAPVVRLFWEGWDETSRLPTDTPDQISEEKLEKAGRALAMALMALGREIEY